MADADYDEFGTFGVHPGQRPAATLRGPQGQTWVRGAGALTSVALIVGLGVWAYDLAVRDVRGVPVIQALEGPARTAPENPGGELASYQGMAVNEIAADGTAGGPADRLTLAPRADDLTAEDQPMGALAASAENTAPAQPAVPEMTPADATESAARPLLPGTGEEAPVLASLTPAEPLPDGLTDTIAADADGAGTEDPAMPAPSVDAIPADVPGVAQSLRPASRPVGASAGGEAVPYDAIAEAAAAAVAEALGAPAPGPLDVTASTLAEGTRLVQIGAYPDEAQARLEWDRTAARFGALMDGKRRVIESAVSGGETFYRLRVEGFADLEEARRFCAAFKAEGAECVPTAVR